jgi:selenocysteine lyase/cysteine desulfurase
LSNRTRFVAVTHCSNITGTLNPIKKVAAIVHATNPHAEIVVEGVAYAPHRMVDVQDLDVDYYAFSYYKVWQFSVYVNGRSTAHIYLFFTLERSRRTISPV